MDKKELRKAFPDLSDALFQQLLESLEDGVIEKEDGDLVRFSKEYIFSLKPLGHFEK